MSVDYEDIASLISRALVSDRNRLGKISTAGVEGAVSKDCSSTADAEDF